MEPIPCATVMQGYTDLFSRMAVVPYTHLGV